MDIKEKIIHLLPAKKLVELAEKKKFSVLAEKFLISAHEKTLSVLRTLVEERKKMEFFNTALSTFPLGILAYFFVPEAFFYTIVSNELYCKGATSLIFGTALCNALSLRRYGFKAFLLIPMSFLFCYSIAEEDFFLFLFADKTQAKLFFALGIGFLFGPFSFLANFLQWRLRKALSKKPIIHHFLGFHEEKQLALQLQKALKQSSEVSAQELSNLVKDYTPEYTSILKALKDKEVP